MTRFEDVASHPQIIKQQEDKRLLLENFPKSLFIKLNI